MAQYVTTPEGILEIQQGIRPAQVLDVVRDNDHTLGGFDHDYGAITRGWRMSPRTGKPVPLPVSRDMPGDITPELTCKMLTRNYLEELGADARFSLYLRHNPPRPGDHLSYTRVEILTNVAIDKITYGDLKKTEPAAGDEARTEITVPINAATHIIIHPVTGAQLETSWTGPDDCAVTAAAVDEDGTIYAVTAADATGGSPFLVSSTDDGATWTEVELTDLTADCTAIVVAGDTLVVAAGTSIAVYTKAGVLSSEYTAAQVINALAAVDAATIYAAGASGLLVKSTDRASSWETVTTGVSVALTSLAVRDINNIYAGGATGTLLHIQSGNAAALTLPATLATASIDALAIPYSPAGFERDETIYIGADNGTVYGSEDNGATWTQIGLPQTTGSVEALGFVDFLGQVLYVLFTPASGSSVIYRDWTRGAGGNNNMEPVTVPANSGLTVLLPITANDVYAFGAVHSGAEMVVKVEAAS